MAAASAGPSSSPGSPQASTPTHPAEPPLPPPTMLPDHKLWSAPSGAFDVQYPDHHDASTANLPDQRTVGVLTGDGQQIRVTVLPADPRFQLAHGELAFAGTGAQFTSRSRKQVGGHEWLLLHGTVPVRAGAQGASPSTAKATTQQICWCLCLAQRQIHMVLLNATSPANLKEGEELLPTMMKTLRARPPKPPAFVQSTAPNDAFKVEHLDTLRSRAGTQPGTRSAMLLEANGVRITVAVAPPQPRFDLRKGEQVFRKGEATFEQRQIKHLGSHDWLLLHGRDKQGRKVSMAICDDTTQLGLVLLHAADAVGYQQGEQALPHLLETFTSAQPQAGQVHTYQAPHGAFSVDHPAYFSPHAQSTAGTLGCAVFEGNGHWLVAGVQAAVPHFNKRHPEKIFAASGAHFSRHESRQAGGRTWYLLFGRSKSGEQICWCVSNSSSRLSFVLLNAVTDIGLAAGLKELPGFLETFKAP